MQKEISFRKLIRQVLPEVWGIQLIAGVFLALATNLIGLLANALLHTRDAALTTANMGSILLSWQGILLIVLGLVTILIFITFEFFSTIYLLDDVLKGRQQNIFKETFSCIRRAFASLPRFFPPSGVLILLYLTIALPLIGIRFLMTFNSFFRIPNFIMEHIDSHTILRILYIVAIIALVLFGLRYVFSVYGILLDKMKPRQAEKYSLELIRKNRKAYLLGTVKLFLVLGAIYAASWLVFRFLPGWILNRIGEANLKAATQQTTYHTIMLLIILGGIIVFNIIQTMLVSYFLLRYARFYDDFRSGTTRTTFVPRTAPGRKIPFVLSLLAIGIVWIASSFYYGKNFDSTFTEASVPHLIAHRTGGVLASENSVEGIELAAQNACEGSETDIRRTVDGQYVINHDNSFQRLTGVDRKPEEMTTEEISQLQIKDTTGNGQLLAVPMLEDLLDASAGNVRLYIELKGSTADEQMVDDVVRLIRDKYDVDEVALISLNYQAIQYAETHYPEFLTGVLIFGGFGNLADMDCDMVMVEEDMVTDALIDEVHSAGKQVVVWTVNTQEGLRKAMTMGVDGVITDQVERANEVIEDVKNRTDVEILEDYLYFHLNLD